MEDQSSTDTTKKGTSKGLIITIIVAFIVIGGGVAAYFAMNPTSDKQKYFLAEKDSAEFITETLEERYGPELDWAELAKTKPSESIIELSAEYNAPSAGGGFGEFDPAEIINNATLTLTAQSDIPNKKLGLGVSASAAGVTVDDINFYLTEEKIMLGLPFLNELLQLKAADTGNILQEIIPEYDESDEDIDFGQFFETAEGYLSEEDKEHFKKEYLDLIYDRLSDDDFTSSNEKIDVNGESIETEKIEFHLSEDKIKEIFADIFDKLAKDERVKELIEEQMTSQFFGLAGENVISNQELEQILSEFEEGMLTAKEEFEKVSIPNGFTSTIWIDNKLIVQRELTIEMGPSADEVVKFVINGTQLLTDENITFAYDFNFENLQEQGTLTVTGDSIVKDDQVTDSIKLVVEDAEIVFENEETLKDGQRDFERVFSFSQPGSGEGSLYWLGNSTYEKDQMNAEHEFSVEATGFDRDVFTLHATIDGKQIKDVDIPDEDIKDLGSMTVDEISMYFEQDVMVEFQKWIMGIMIDAGADLGL